MSTLLTARPNVTRLAPSPTGALHLGNARTFLANFALARRRGWRVLLRIDDLEGPRVKPGADAMAVEDLRWLELEWEGEPIRQSARAAAHGAALSRLERTGLTYRCDCPRSRISAESSRRAADGADVYGGRCARLLNDEGAVRLRVAGEAAFDDERLGRVTTAAGEVGDFVVRKADGEFAYQLASVADDLADGVTHVVRGEDLLASTARQCFVYRALGREAELPAFVHLPLVVGRDGRKLAKRHGDTRLRQLRDEGVSAGVVRGLLARMSGFEPAGEDCGVEEWADRFDLGRLPASPAVYDDAADRPTVRP